MKTTIFTLTIIFSLACLGVNAQDFDDIYKKYKKEQDVTGIKINKLGCLLLSLFGDDDNEEMSKLMKKSSSFRFLVSENAHNNNMENDIRKYIKKQKLEQLMSISEENENIEIFIRDKNEVIHQLLILIKGKNEQVIVHIDGKYPLKMVQELLSDKKSISIKTSL